MDLGDRGPREYIMGDVKCGRHKSNVPHTLAVLALVHFWLPLPAFVSIQICLPERHTILPNLFGRRVQRQ